MVYRFYCIALYNSQTRRHVINVIFNGCAPTLLYFQANTILLLVKTFVVVFFKLKINNIIRGQISNNYVMWHKLHLYFLILQRKCAKSKLHRSSLHYLRVNVYHITYTMPKEVKLMF